jgi:hypothetical protein
VSKLQDTKAARRVSAVAAGNDRGGFEETAFGRRRISRVPHALTTLGRLITIPFVLVYRRVKRAGGG